MNYSFSPGYTALHIAVEYCNLNIVPVLLQRNADIYARNSEGLNPVHMCLRQKIKLNKYMLHHCESICVLVKRKLEISDQILYLMLQKYSTIDSNGLSHLHMACVMANSSLANHLLEEHINIDHSLDMDSPIFADYTALHFAAQCNIDTVKLLVAKGANMLLEDSNKLTPLDLCLRRCSVETVHSILLCHPVWRDILLVDDKTKLTDLIYALRKLKKFRSFVRSVCLNVKKALIPSNSPLWPGYTVLHLIINLSNNRDHYFYRDLISECLEKGAIATEQDSLGSTPLHLAVLKEEHIHPKIFTQLLGYCKNILNAVDKNNLSHLHILCSDTYSSDWRHCRCFSDKPDLLEKLLLHDMTMKVDSNIAYKGLTIKGIVSGSTPLHLAVSKVKETKLLMKYGADIYAVDSHGCTPIHRLMDNTERYRKYDKDKKAGAILLATPDLRDCIVDSVGLSHLHVASYVDDVKSVKKLLDRGTDINLRISLELPAEFLFLKEYAGYTPLHIAATEDCKKVVNFLLRHGADMFTKKNDDDLPLIYKILNSAKSECLLAAFVRTLENNYALQKRFNEETGLTMFHIACHKLDVKTMKHYLQNAGVNVNAQARKDSPTWPGFAALHILSDRMRKLYWYDNFISAKDKLKNDNSVNSVLNFLLNNGADVTIADSNGNTPLHLFYHIMTAGNEKSYARVSSVLKAQKDFSLNPIDPEGISHFHVACAMNDSTAVQQFLKQGIDVNKPNNQGNTPLHFSADSYFVEFSGSTAQLKTIDRLLKCGAELDAKNNVGNTPLHEAAAGSSIADVKVFQRLLRAGADPYAENSQGFTPLEFLCTSRKSSVKHFQLFVKRGCQLNAYNPTSNEGFIGLILNSRNPEWESIWKAVLSLPEVKKTDKSGRSVIHNVVSLRESTVRIDCYPKIIDQLVNVGCQIDAQDEKGETALHRAVKFSNVVSVSALIEAGADINVVDNNGKTALACALQDRISRILLRQVSISLYFRLHVCQMNNDLRNESKTNFHWFQTDTDESLFDELDQAKDVKIGESLTLQHFLTEETIFSYPYTSLSNRTAIRAFVKSIDNQTLKPVIKLVFRQAEMRIDLIKRATNSLRILSGSPVPDVCSRIIFEFFRNADLANLIAAAFEEA